MCPFHSNIPVSSIRTQLDHSKGKLRSHGVICSTKQLSRRSDERINGIVPALLSASWHRFNHRKNCCHPYTKCNNHHNQQSTHCECLLLHPWSRQIQNSKRFIPMSEDEAASNPLTVDTVIDQAVLSLNINNVNDALLLLKQALIMDEENPRAYRVPLSLSLSLYFPSNPPLSSISFSVYGRCSMSIWNA
eukprot:TRINITY_DN4591_c0_g1_i4.p1 TRINITY_DN4591_c0_g1~~TRINITY_DN4591_c0_g1_i4.p1  ORF type:complete len:203 (+),score=11.83 TRINITY_DN4591_c0_g1_i4:42-611(+)